VSWPLRDCKARVGLYGLTVVVLSVAAGWKVESWAMGTMVFLAVGSTLWKMWLPITVEFGPFGVDIHCGRWRRRLAWTQIERVGWRPGGVAIHLSGGSGPAPLRMIFLPWYRDRQPFVEVADRFLAGANREQRR